MIAARDIGAFAAEALLRLDLRGKQTQELLGPRDITYPRLPLLSARPSTSLVSNTSNFLTSRSGPRWFRWECPNKWLDCFSKWRQR